MDQVIEEISSNQILTPEKVRRENPPTMLWVRTGKYGETRSVLKPGYERGSKEILNGYDIEVPDKIMSLAQEVRNLGGKALLVGGCVRDLVISKERALNLKPKDFDVEVYGLSQETLRLILETNFGEVKTEGKSFAVIKLPSGNHDEPYDISIPRRDSKVASGHTGFDIKGDPTMDIKEAASRRDITINSLAYDPLNKTLYDAFEGAEHIKEGLIEITDEKTFQEDPLRVFRVMQFAARFDFQVSERALKLCRQMVKEGQLDELSTDRITEELKKLIVKGIKPSIGLNFAKEAGIVERYWPELNALINIPQEDEWHPEGNVWKHTLQTIDAAAKIADREKLDENDRLTLVFSSLLHDTGKPLTTKIMGGRVRSYGHEAAGIKPTSRFFERFNLPVDVKRKVLALIPVHLSPKFYWDQEVNKGIEMKNAIRRLADKLGKEGANIYMLSLLAEADQRGRNSQDSTPLDRSQVKNLEGWQNWLIEKAQKLDVKDKAPAPILNGKDILEKIGTKNGGIWIGCMLKAVQMDFLDGTLSGKSEALEKALEYLNTFEKIVNALSQQYSLTPRAIWEKVVNLEDPRKADELLRN